ncbi:hypothetical protein BDY21DRAFT_341761 [Lineolata rhizophorae]|uniref:Uncharacterized protein n=1 Tax=Lineolata rhizophorae TaxID=578093 RepID=A0A6A6P2I0_9PEZI|nr:hypothetical protein BDY21DRAFT_341761 [Lineolata rhizophorae]
MSRPVVSAFSRLPAPLARARQQLGPRCGSSNAAAHGLPGARLAAVAQRGASRPFLREYASGSKNGGEEPAGPAAKKGPNEPPEEPTFREQLFTSTTERVRREKEFRRQFNPEEGGAAEWADFDGRKKSLSTMMGASFPTPRGKRCPFEW